MSFKISGILKFIKKIKGIVLLNMAGLSLGLLSVIFIAIWVSHELSFDKWVEDSERIFRVEALMNFAGEPLVWSSTQAPLVESLLNDYPEIEKGVRIKSGYKTSLEIGEELFISKNLYYAPGSFFDIFPLENLQGDSRTALDEPNAIVLSERIARKYFGDTDPIGKLIIIDNKDEVVVKGVIENTPSNSHLIFDYLVSDDVHFKTVSNPDDWGQFNYYNYIKLKEGVSAEEFNSKLASYLVTKREKAKGKFFLNPLERIYLYRNPGFDSLVYPGKSKGPISRVILFGVIGIIILLIAIINFVNLTTAFSTRRAKEIGVRKVNGAGRADLLGSLFGESVFQTLLSVIIALIAAIPLLPFFNAISGKQFMLSDLFSLRSILIYLSIAMVTGLVAGLYPALILSSFKPVRVLRNNPEDLTMGGGFRKILVLVQFVITILFVFCIIVINRQIKYMQHIDLGFDKEKVIVYTTREKYDKVKVISEEIARLPGVDKVALGSSVPVNMGNWSTFSEWEGNKDGKTLRFHMMQVDDNYIDLLGFEFVEGRPLFKGPPRDEVVINQAAVREMGIENPLGKTIPRSFKEKHDFEIVGVVKDFHFRKLNDEIRPVFIYKNNDWYSPKIFVKLAAGTDFSVVERVSSVVQDATPAFPVSYIFLDDEITNCYNDEFRLSRLINIATVFSIIISCIGLFSLTAFSILRRQKEIGVRKVHGSGTGSLLLILNREYWILIFIATIIALPLGQFIISRWLDSYAYHIGVKPGFYIITFLSILVIATVTISFHTVRASNLNPADTLRDE